MERVSLRLRCAPSSPSPVLPNQIYPIHHILSLVPKWTNENTKDLTDHGLDLLVAAAGFATLSSDCWIVRFSRYLDHLLVGGA
jgi:hypothetical protein